MSFAQRLSKIQRKASEGNQISIFLENETQKVNLKNCRKLTEFQKHHSDLKSMLQELQCGKSSSLYSTPAKDKGEIIRKQSLAKAKVGRADSKQNKANKILFQDSPEKRQKLKINKLPEQSDFFELGKDSVLMQNLKYSKRSSKQNPESSQPNRKQIILANKSSFTQKKGIPNNGNTCYINAVLQCLFHLKDFNQGFHIFVTQKMEILNKYMKLFEAVTSKTSQRCQISTLPLKKSVSKICSLFIDFHQEDAHEFLKQLLDSIHQQINKVKTPGVYKVLEANSLRKNLSVLSQQYWNYYKKFDDSYIYDSLCGQICNYVTCANCKYESVGFDNFLDISLPIVKGKNKLEDLLKQYFDIETLQDYYFCSSCKKSSKKSLKRSQLWRNPNYLIIQLKRSQFGRKNNQHIKLPVRCLNMKPYLTQVEKQPRSSMYHLQGVVLHRGVIDGGHYWAQVKDGLHWYKIDDEKVDKLDKDTVINNFENLGTEEAYILFYRCM